MQNSGSRGVLCSAPPSPASGISPGARGESPATRPEIFVKVIGPRPNGFLWVQLIRFTPSEVEVWLRQGSTGLINYYRLEALPPTGGPLVGAEDRTAYLP